MTPYHQHDCDNCRFLGQVVWNEADSGGVADLYLCPNDSGLGPTLIGRTGDLGDYVSCPVSLVGNGAVHPLIAAAYARINRLGGSIAKRGETIEGTYRQNAYSDSWQEARPIKYDGELTPEVCKAIQTAWEEHYRKIPRESSWGALRWSSPDSFVSVDVERRAVIVSCSVNLCD